jgi:hypothetical protein
MRIMIQLTWKHRPLVEVITIIFLDSEAKLTSVRSVAGLLQTFAVLFRSQLKAELSCDEEQ